MEEIMEEIRWKEEKWKHHNSTRHEVEPLCTIDQGIHNTHSCLSLNLAGGKYLEMMKEGLHFYQPP